MGHQLRSQRRWSSVLVISTPSLFKDKEEEEEELPSDHRDPLNNDHIQKAGRGHLPPDISAGRVCNYLYTTANVIN